MAVTGVEADAITLVLHDYFEGWFDGDVERVDRALHRDLVKRSPTVAEPGRLGMTSKRRMLELTEAGEGRADGADRRLDVVVADVHGDIASAVVHSASYREYVHLVRTDGRWQVASSLWQPS
jgi:hypothetical protein